jgi:pimeloyl-ACP methyl ester carboxylesterase
MNAPPEYVTRPDGTRLALRRMGQPKGKSGPTLVFLPGYMSDMQGAKALALEAWAVRNNRSVVRFDYAGCGESGGQFADYTLDDWLADTLLILDLVVRGPAVLVGSSMGGWLMLLAALARPSDVRGLIGIAAAPDFTRWGFSDDEKMRLHRDGRIEETTPYGPDPYITTLDFWRSGEGHLLLNKPEGIPITCPVRLIHGQADPDVPWDIALKTAAALHSADVQVQLIKDGDHRLSRDTDIALICDCTARLYQTIGHI